MDDDFFHDIRTFEVIRFQEESCDFCKKLAVWIVSPSAQSLENMVACDDHQFYPYS